MIERDSTTAIGLLALVLFTGQAPSVAAQTVEATGANAAQPGRLLTPDASEAVQKGLRFLASRQNPDGSYGNGDYSRNVAICSLAAMAFMSAGSTPDRGPHGREVSRTVRFILDNVQESGYIQVPEYSSHGPMYGHGFATLFLAECYGMWPDADLREKLAKAVRLIVNSQNKHGAWRYSPGTQEEDLSVTVCQIMALRAARNAGIYVPSRTIEQCVLYVKRAQNEDGGFMYRLELRDPSRFPRSAAGVVALQSAGVYRGDEIQRGLQYISASRPTRDTFNRESHYFYGHYYAVQAMWLAGGDYWRNWYPAIRTVLVDRQKEDGSWFDSVSVEYGSAMACIILQMPNSYLPIFQR